MLRGKVRQLWKPEQQTVSQLCGWQRSGAEWGAQRDWFKWVNWFLFSLGPHSPGMWASVLSLHTTNVSLLHNCSGTGILHISGPGSKSLPPFFFHEVTLERVFGAGRNYFFSSRCQVISRKIVFLVTSYYILASHLVWVANSFYWQPPKNQRSFLALIYERKQNNTRKEHSRGFTFSNSHLCLISSECI